MDDPALLSTIELMRMLDDRQVSSAELLAHHLERIERLDREVNAFVTLDAERAAAGARSADDARARGERPGPLHGLPMTVKDCFETAGLRTTGGVVELAAHVPDRDADAVARLRGAGAVIFGKTNLPAHARDGQSYNEVAGTTNNPWDTARAPGGSSGGAAAALAAGFTPLELGSDIAGSLRHPAHFCGVFGFKPSSGVVPTQGHIPGPPGTLAPADMNVVGPMARSAEDLALAFDVLAGPDAADARAWRLELPPPRANDAGGYRLAVWLDDEACRLDAEVLAVLRGAADALADAGFALEERPGPVPLAGAIRVHRALLMGVAASRIPEAAWREMDGAVRAGAPTEGSDAARHLGLLVQSKRAWNAADEERARMRQRWHEFFGEVDALLCPVCPVVAIPHDHAPDLDTRTITANGELRPYWDQIGWLAPASAAHLPAVSVPAGLAASGLPVGLQIVAPYLEDRTALDLASRIGEALGGFSAPPAFSTAAPARSA